MKKSNNTFRLFSLDDNTPEILKKITMSIPPKTKVYVIGGAARNRIYFDFFKESLPQRDYDLLLVGDLNKFIENLRKKYRFVYEKIRRKDEIVLKKKLIPKPLSITDYVVLDIHRTYESNILKNLKDNSAFTINGFAIPVRHFLSKNFKKHIVALDRAIDDLKNKSLRLIERICRQMKTMNTCLYLYRNLR